MWWKIQASSTLTGSKGRKIGKREVIRVDRKRDSENAFTVLMKGNAKKINKCCWMLDKQEVPAVIKCGASAQLELDDPAEVSVVNMEVIISQ